MTLPSRICFAFGLLLALSAATACPAWAEDGAREAEDVAAACRATMEGG